MEKVSNPSRIPSPGALAAAASAAPEVACRNVRRSICSFVSRFVLRRRVGSSQTQNRETFLSSFSGPVFFQTITWRIGGRVRRSKCWGFFLPAQRGEPHCDLVCHCDL